MGFDGLFDDLEAHGTARFTLTGVKVRGDKDVVLIGKHAGHGNKGWENAKRKIDAKLKARSGSVSGADLLEALIPPFAQFVLTGWENVHEADAALTKFAPTVCAELLTTIAAKAPDIVDQSIGYFLNPNNFRDTPSGVAEALGNG